MRGHCLCGQIGFEIDGSRIKLYQCHCSLCRRQGGSLSNTATIVSNERFRWLQGADRVSSWIKDSGFRSDFCATCGSPVPNPLRKLPYYWIPAGLLEDTDCLEIVAHLHLSSRAPWDSIPTEGACFENLPKLRELLELLHSNGN